VCVNNENDLMLPLKVGDGGDEGEDFSSGVKLKGIISVENIGIIIMRDAVHIVGPNEILERTGHEPGIR